MLPTNNAEDGTKDPQLWGSYSGSDPYANNRHHPEHFSDGIKDMTLIDLTEMLCDWVAASRRHRDGNVKESLEHAKTRFGLSEQLSRILENTIELFEE